MSNSSIQDRPVAPEPEGRDSWPIYRRLLGYSKRYWTLIAFGVVGMVIDAASTAGFTALLKPLMDQGFLADSWESVRWLPLWTLAIFAARGVGTLISDYCMMAAGRSVIFDLRQESFEKMLDLPSAFYDHNPPGQLISKLTFNVEQVANASTDALTILVRDSLYIIGFLAVMLYNSVTLTLAVLVLAPVLGLLARFVAKRFRKLSHRIQGSVGDVAHRASEVIAGHQVVKLFGAQSTEQDHFREINLRNRRQHLKLVLTKSGSAAFVHVVVGIALAGIIFLAISPYGGEHMTAGGFMAFVTAMLAILPSLRRLTNVLATVQRGVAAADSLFDTLDQPGETDDGDHEADKLKGQIRFRGVSLAYAEDGRAALENIDLDTRPGTTTAIVGRSGSGKTSLVSLIPRFYRPTAGQVEIDGIDVSDYRLASLRRQVAVVSQHVVLFNDTVAANIAYGRLHDADRDSVQQAARRAGAMAFIERLPNGLDTLIGSEGVQLSGGERQRIAIARAILQDAPILVLDEATSALDTETERDVYRALEELAHERTTLVIAHRLSTVENADQVVVLDQGRLVEQGTHEQLMRRGGHYAALHQIQFRDDADE